MEFKLGELVTIENYGTITQVNRETKRVRVTFDSGDDVYLPLDYVVRAPKPLEGESITERLSRLSKLV